MAVVTLINAIAVRSKFSPKPYSHGNRAESCDYEKEDAPYSAETYERVNSFEVHVAAPSDATSANGLRPRKRESAYIRTMVMGGYGQRGFRQLSFGSTTRALLENTLAPLRVSLVHY
jgi:hypothetical protein